MIVDPILNDSLRIDLTFILYFWIGVGLLDGRNGRRKLAIVLTSLSVLLVVGYLIYLIWATGPVPGRGRELQTPLLASVYGAVLLVLLLPPLILLLLPGTRRWFAEMRETPPPRYLLTRREIALYVLAACVPIAGAVALERGARTADPHSSAMTFGYGERKLGFAAAGCMKDKESGQTLWVSWLAFAEATSHETPQDGHVTFGPHRVPVPGEKPIRYLFTPPNDEESKGNVLIVREDGRVIRLARRVSPDRLESAREAAQGVRDFEELQKRLEVLLPSTPVATTSP